MEMKSKSWLWVLGKEHVTLHVAQAIMDLDAIRTNQ
jgi:hypothetical protein